VGLRRELGRRVAVRLAAVEQHEQLGARVLAVEDGEEHGALVTVRDLEHPIAKTHSKRSTKTSISPPQGRPTPIASSSEIPYVSSFGSPVFRTSCACSKTSPSTQPPDTEPQIWPLSETANFEPTGRGAESRVATTVATATRSPCSRQRSTSWAISFTRRASSRFRRARQRARRGSRRCARAGTGRRTGGPRACRPRVARSRRAP